MHRRASAPKIPPKANLAVTMISSSRILCALALLVCAPLFAAGDTREQIEFFERKIRPVLVKHCYECHSADSDIVQAGLRVDHPEGMTRGR